MLCVGGVKGEYPAAPLGAGLTLEVGLMALAFSTLCLVHQFALGLTVFETGKVFLTCQVGFGHADHELVMSGWVWFGCLMVWGHLPAELRRA